MHIPDGFLSAPVWATLDVAAVPTVAYIARRAQRTFEEDKAPLLGVLGAFVFAAQMINFPVGPGTTGHLVGGALLAFSLGPAAATVVMTAILAIQALVFQDGGILALGANVLNMAVLGVLAAYIPYSIWSRTRWRKFSLFAGATLSVLVSAVLALSELFLSGVRMPSAVLGVSLALFAVSALLEGAITLAVVQALERIQPKAIRQPLSNRSLVLAMVSLAAILLASVGVLFAAAAPDGIERLGQQAGISSHVRTLFRTPFADYQAAFWQSAFLSKAAAGLAGVALIYAACLLLSRAVGRKRSI
ncbi:MAG: cobalt transporter [Terriglobia bacterium]|nr:MAG: cobalt transporter [Terriglobia bacterium]